MFSCNMPPALLALLFGQQCQTLHCLSVSSMKMSDSKCVFTVDALLKQSHKGKHLAPLEFLAFPQNEFFSVLKEYLHRMKGNPRGGKQTTAELPGTTQAC